MAHTIRPGETLSGIAKRYGTTVAAIARANGIANPNLIHAGRTLQIPGRSDSFASSSSKGASKHVVRPGDTLSGLAAKYGTTVSALARANGIANVNLIRVGQSLTIPGRSSSPSAPSTSVSGSPGKFGSKAAHLANVARNVAANMNTRG